MEFRKANDRIKSSEYWLNQITQEYCLTIKKSIILTATFLVASYSIVDVVKYDFLNEGNFRIKVKEFHKIIKNKDFSRIPEKLLNENGNQIATFFEKHEKQFQILLQNDLICYFITLRNLIVHSNLADFYDNTISGSIVSSRHFKTEMFQRILSQRRWRIFTLRRWR